jgi:hypothetical protein
MSALARSGHWPPSRDFREHLEDQGGGLGLTDPVSGEAVLKLPATKPAAKKGRVKKTTKRKKRR